MRAARVGRAVAFCLLVAGSGASRASGQDAEPGRAGEVSRSPVTLDGDHWAVAAAWRAEALGYAPGFLPARTRVARDLVWAALRAAAEAGEPMAAGWVARFTEEFPEYRADAGGGSAPALLGSSVGAEMAVARGRAGPGRGEFPPERTGAEPLADLTRPAARADLAVGFGSHLGVQTRLQAAPDSSAVMQLTATARLGPVALTGGRGRVGYSTGVGGGVVLADGVPIDGVELESWRPVRGPGVLRYLGPVSYDLFFGKIPGSRHPGDPYFWGGRASIQPHPRMTFTVQRAALFGGAGSDKPVTAGNVLRMLIGRVVGGSFEDQIVSVSGRFRLPTESTLPLVLYADVGSEDAAGAFRKVPGLLAGLETAALPGARWMSLGVEGSVFAHSCCGNPPWYRHFAFPGAWALDDRPLGHRLGGQGSELLVHGRADLLDSRLRLRGQAFRRGRSGENLYVPGRQGGSLGGGGAVTWRVSPAAELVAGGTLEDGRDWTEGSVRVAARWLF